MTFKIKLITLSVCLLVLMGCSQEKDLLPQLDPIVLTPGDMLPMNTIVKISSSGTYILPADADLLTTRCFGTVTVTFDPKNGNQQVNSCQSETGGSQQTNNVNGVTQVFYEVEETSYAEATLN